jgi:large subunit ribosomal protein L12e
MAPKIDADEVKVVYVRQYGGEIAAGSVLAPKVGPLGMSPKKVGEDIQKASMEWKGIRITAKLTCKNRVATVELVPTATSMLVKELKEPMRDRKKVKNIKHSGNLTKEQIFKVATAMRSRSMAKTMAGTVKEILGTCVGIGCTVEGRNPRELQAEIDQGIFVVPQ